MFSAVCTEELFILEIFRPKGSEESLISTHKSFNQTRLWKFNQFLRSIFVFVGQQWGSVLTAYVGTGSDVYVIDPWANVLKHLDNF